MHGTRKNLLYLAIAGAVIFPAADAWSRELSNIDALATATPAPQPKVARATPALVKRVVRDEQLGVASFVWLNPAAREPGGIQRKQAEADPVAAARGEFKAVADLYGVTSAELDTAPAQLHSTSLTTTKLVRFTGQRDGIPVFREQATVLLNAQSLALNIGGYLGSTKLAPVKKTAASRTFSPAKAAQVALRDFDFAADIAAQFFEPENARTQSGGSGFGWLDLPKGITGSRGAVLERPVRYQPVWFRLPQGLVAATYLEVRVLEDGEHHAYSYVVATQGGEVLFRNHQSSHQSATRPLPGNSGGENSAVLTYGVWADPQTGVPYPGPQGLDLNPYPNARPDGYSAKLIPPSRLTVMNAAPSKPGSWVDMSVNARQLGFTSGNNVQAWADVKSPNGFSGLPIANTYACYDGQQAVDADFFACTAGNAFDYGYDFSADPLKNQAQASASVANLFYTLNWLHDWFYDAGFDEASGNAQASNFGRGGVEGDPIDARALVFGPRNNASMDTPADGASPIMRAYLYELGSTPSRSAALDNTIVTHEWGHYLTKRLIGNANGLTARLANGLGEGWSDFVAQLVTVTEKDRGKPGNEHFQGAYAQGAYTNSGIVFPATDERNATYFGSRRYPYSTDMSKNPLTFKHIQDGEPLPKDVPVNHVVVDQPLGVVVGNSEIHNVGEVWASMLWECYASMLNQREFNDAKRRMSGYLVTSLKLTPVNPTFTEARDALLASMAASDSQDYASCMGAFAKRGAGLDAQAPPRSSVDLRGVVESYAAGPMLVVEGLSLSMSDAQATRCDADDLLDNNETAVLNFLLTNRGDKEVTGVVIALSSDTPQLRFLGGERITLSAPIAPGKSLPVRARVYLAGLDNYAHAALAVNIAATDQAAGVRGQSIPVWLNADIKPQDSSTDAVTVWPGGMPYQDAGWSVAGKDGENWYQFTVQNNQSVVTMYTPELKVSNHDELVLTFDHEYDFGRDATNGGQLVISEPHSRDLLIDVPGAAYPGSVWWLRNGVANTNELRDQRAYVGSTSGWQRDLAVNLGQQYAGKTVRIGWRVGAAESGNPDRSQFWRLDNIRLAGIENKPFASIRKQEKNCPDLQEPSGGIPPVAAPEDPGGVSRPVVVNDAGLDPLARPGQTTSVQAPAAGVLDEIAGTLVIKAVVSDRQISVQLADLANAKEGEDAKNVTPVPSLSQWALGLLTLALAAIGGYVRRQRRFKA